MEIKSFRTHLGPLLVADNFVPLPLQQALTDITCQPIWKYGWRSNNRRDRYCYWHAHIAGGDGNARANCEAELAAQPAYSAIYTLSKILQTVSLRGYEFLLHPRKII